MVGRLTLSNGCVSGLKEVGLVRSGSVRSMFDTIFDRPSGFVFKEARDTCKGRRSSDFLNKVAN